MTSMTEVLDTLRAAADRRDRAGILSLVTPDVEYHYHVGSKPLVGVDRIGRFLDDYWGRSKDNVWDIYAAAETGDKLLVEGCEEYTDLASGRRVVNRYMGIFEFRGGRIAKWRDYFHMQPQPQAPVQGST